MEDDDDVCDDDWWYNDFVDVMFKSGTFDDDDVNGEVNWDQYR